MCVCVRVCVCVKKMPDLTAPSQVMTGWAMLMVEVLFVT